MSYYVILYYIILYYIILRFVILYINPLYDSILCHSLSVTLYRFDKFHRLFKSYLHNLIHSLSISLLYFTLLSFFLNLQAIGTVIYTVIKNRKKELNRKGEISNVYLNLKRLLNSIALRSKLLYSQYFLSLSLSFFVLAEERMILTMSSSDEPPGVLGKFHSMQGVGPNNSFFRSIKPFLNTGSIIFCWIMSFSLYYFLVFIFICWFCIDFLLLDISELLIFVQKILNQFFYFQFPCYLPNFQCTISKLII